MSWVPVYTDGVPVEMRWDERPDRVERRCPRTWPHDAHGTWSTGEIWRPGDGHVGSFDCPGVPMPTKGAKS